VQRVPEEHGAIGKAEAVYKLKLKGILMLAASANYFF
jgi:hypothetical protein